MLRNPENNKKTLKQVQRDTPELELIKFNVEYLCATPNGVRLRKFENRKPRQGETINRTFPSPVFRIASPTVEGTGMNISPLQILLTEELLHYRFKQIIKMWTSIPR